MGKVIGIDLGTTNSCVAVTEGQKTTVIPNKGGYKTTPSVVAISDDGKILVGQIARRQAITNPERTISSTKRLIGRRINSREADVAQAIYPYSISEGPHGDIRVKVQKRELSLPEISAFILMEMKHVAEAYLNGPVTEAVVTVPAYFNDGQRQATKDAGKIAGLEILRIINEPTAAAIAYGFSKRSNKNIAIFDLGGGTFDISFLEIHEGVFKVLATGGDTFLGGDDIDNLLIDHVAGKFLKETQIDVRANAMALQRLRDAAERAKCDLSRFHEVEISLPFVAEGADGPIHLKETLARKVLEGLCKDLLDRCLVVCAETMKSAGLAKEDLDDVLMVGGQTRMPIIQDAAGNFFGRSASKQVHPDEAVAVGAAIQGSALRSEEDVEMLLLDVTPLSLGIESAGGMFTRVIEANTTVPVTQKRNFTTVSDNQKTVRIQVFQGESPVAKENDLLGEFFLTGIRDAAAGEPEVEVAFDIDANGIVHVSAKDLQTGKEQSITITMSSGLTDDEIDFAKGARQDYEVRLKDEEEGQVVAQQLEVALHRMRNLFTDKAEGLSPKLQKRYQDAFERAESLLVSDNPKNMKKAIAAMDKVAKELS